MTDQHRLRPGDPTTRLDADRRQRDLATIRGGRPIDVLVVGGGITGTGVALDAASRGLRVVLVERHDLASGTSRWSSKLIHGGLRYLAKGDVGIAWESALERAVIGSRIAPHLVHPLTQVLPLREGEELARLGARAGLLAADALRVAARTDRRLLTRSAPVELADLPQLAPALKTEGLRGALAVADLQMEDDARFVVAVARTAAAYGARILTRVSVEEMAGGRVRLLDRTTGEDYWVRPRTVVNATGVWAGDLDPDVRLAPSRGTHLVVRSAALDDTAVCLSIPVPGTFGRFVFTLPQPDGLTYIGLTDEPLDGPIPEVPEAPDADVRWILDVLNPALRRPLEMADVVGRFAGLRPLMAGAADSAPADLSRRHAILRHGSLITVTGGKFTSYRRMAEEVVDLLTARPCRTRDLPLIGAGPVPAETDIPQRLWRRYGTEAPLVWSLAAADASLREQLASGCPVLGVEAAFAVAWEGARVAADVLDRRTRLGLVPADASMAAAGVERIVSEWSGGPDRVAERATG
jgi:glycerol-3-phosphate dehydrogenase